MLVLTRRIGEELVIGGDVRVTVLGATATRVRLGVTAPRLVRIDRLKPIGGKPVGPTEEPRARKGDHADTSLGHPLET